MLLFPLADLRGQNISFISTIEEEAFDQATFSSSTGFFQLLLASEPGMTKEKIGTLQMQLNSFVLGLGQEKINFSSEKKYLQWIVKEVRDKYLYNYEQYPTFGKLFANGTYNCLSGSALYGLVLQQLNYRVEIHETAFHAYIIINTPKRNFLIDATDAENGFLPYAYQIQAREALYRENEQARHQPAFNRVITFTELAGLHYYNKAIVQFNAQNYSQSFELLQKAAQLYPRSERIQYMQVTALQHVEKFESAAVARKVSQKPSVQEANKNGLTHK